MHVLNDLIVNKWFLFLGDYIFKCLSSYGPGSKYNYALVFFARLTEKQMQVTSAHCKICSSVLRITCYPAAKHGLRSPTTTGQKCNV